MQGVSKTFHLNVGLTNALLTFVLLVIVYLLDKKQFQIGMVLAVEFAIACVLVAIGPMVQFVMNHMIKQA